MVRAFDPKRDSFEGIGTDGKPMEFRFAQGRWYAIGCNKCNEWIGGGIENEKHKAADNLPASCCFCGAVGSIEIVYEDEESSNDSR